MDIGNKSRPAKCRWCQREYNQAISEQTMKGKVCDDSRCEFKNEIELALNGDVAYCTHCGKKFYSASDNYCIYCGTKRV